MTDHTVSDSRELRCLACCLGLHGQCRGDPCECPPHVPAPRSSEPWPAQTAGDPWSLPFPRRERNREETA